MTDEQPAPDWRNDPAQPVMKPVEKGRLFEPQYETEAADFDVKTAEWEHVAACRFGPGRSHDPNRPKVKWTGKSHRYDIFRKVPNPYTAEEVSRLAERGLVPPVRPIVYAIRWSHGGGDGWLVNEGGHRNATFNPVALIAGLGHEPDRWDFCHFVCESVDRSASAAARKMAKEYSKAFVEGRLKKHKVRGQNRYTVEIVPPAVEAK